MNQIQNTFNVQNHPQKIPSRETLFISIIKNKFTCKNLKSSKLPPLHKTKIKKFLKNLNKSEIKLLKDLKKLSIILIIFGIIFIILHYTTLQKIILYLSIISFISSIIIYCIINIKSEKLKKKWKNIFENSKNEFRNFFEIFDVTPLRSKLKRINSHRNRNKNKYRYKYRTVYYKNWFETKYKFLSLNFAKIGGCKSTNGNIIFMTNQIPGFVVNQPGCKCLGDLQGFGNQNVFGNKNLLGNNQIDKGFQNSQVINNLENQRIINNRQLNNSFNFQNQQLDNSFQNQQMNNSFQKRQINNNIQNQQINNNIQNQQMNNSFQNQQINNSFQNQQMNNIMINQQINNNFQNPQMNNNIKNQKMNNNIQNQQMNNSFQNQEMNNNTQNQPLNNNFQNQQMNNNIHINNINELNNYENNIILPLRNIENEQISLSKKKLDKKNSLIPINTINLKSNSENQNIKIYPQF